MRPFLACVLALAALAVPQFASTVYSALPDYQQAENMAYGRLIDDFTISRSTPVAAIRFWMIGDEFTPLPSIFPGTISWAIYADASQTPLGGTIAFGVANDVMPIATGNSLSGNPPSTYPVYVLDFDLFSPVFLGPGRYWLELHDGPTLSYSYARWSGWLTHTYSTTRGSPFLWYGNTPDFPALGGGYYGDSVAFELFDTPSSDAPEPGHLGLVICGLSVLLIGRFVRSSRLVRLWLGEQLPKHSEPTIITDHQAFARH